MLIRFSLFILLTLFIAGCASRVAHSKNEIACIQIKDQNGLSETINNPERLEQFESVDFLQSQPYKQILRVYNKDQEGKSHSIFTSYHSNGLVKQYLEGIDTIAKGDYKEWYSNGQIKIVAHVVGGPCDLNPSAQNEWLFDGESKAWSEDGNLEAIFNYDKGALNGTTLYFFASGAKKKSISYQRNQIHGEICTYFENGALKSKTDYVQGKKSGTSLGYWQNEKPSYFEEYNNGNLITGIYYSPTAKVASEVQGGSGFRSFFKDGSLHETQEFRDGVLDGLVESYDRYGEKVRQLHMKNGMKQGEEVEYYQINQASSNIESRKKLSISWDEDMIHGIVKTWYPNGKLETQKEFYQNKKNGSACGWYSDGSVMFIEEYEKDLLDKGTYYKQHQKSPASKVVEGSGTASIYDGKTGAFIRKVQYLNGKPQE